MLQAQQDLNATYLWLSKDDQVVALTVEDFGTLGGLIAEYKKYNLAGKIHCLQNSNRASANGGCSEQHKP